jgi:hypothetical protein
MPRRLCLSLLSPPQCPFTARTTGVRNPDQPPTTDGSGTRSDAATSFRSVLSVGNAARLLIVAEVEGAGTISSVRPWARHKDPHVSDRPGSTRPRGMRPQEVRGASRSRTIARRRAHGSRCHQPVPGGTPPGRVHHLVDPRRLRARDPHSLAAPSRRLLRLLAAAVPGACRATFATSE